MAMADIFLADTYALIEIIKGNPRYAPYLDRDLITTEYCVVELYYHCLQEYGKEEADRYLLLYSELIVSLSNATIQRAMEFKLQFKKEKLSYADCLGYALAEELNVPFLTGDEKFENKDNVEFVK